MLEGKTILVTGVGTGLGREVACQCVRDGARVVLGARTASQLEAVAREADPSGERVATVPVDIRPLFPLAGESGDPLAIDLQRAP